MNTIDFETFQKGNHRDTEVIEEHGEDGFNFCAFWGIKKNHGGTEDMEEHGENEFGFLMKKINH